jgi:amidase
VSNDLARMDATAQAELVSSGEASPIELVDAAIERMERINPEVNAVIHDLSEEGRELAAGDVPDGPFKGVPFLLKDIGATFAGEPFHLGSTLLKEADFRAPVDTFLAQRFRDAGLITFGKTNVPEFGIVATTESQAYGPARNPWDTSRSTGGSSGGAAAAVAAGIIPMAHANDGGGSTRIPASNNGLVGLKTTRQRTSEGPIIGENMGGLTGELCVSRSVRDTARLLDAVHGWVPGDPYTAPQPTRPYVEELSDESTGLRFGLMTRAAVELEVHPECVEAATRAAHLIESLGHEVSDSSFLDLLPPPGEGPDLEDSFITRYAAGQAATIATLSMVLGREITAEDVEPLTWALAEVGRERDSGRYLLDLGLHHGLSRIIAGWFESGYDLLITPTMAELPPPLGAIDTSAPGLEAMHRCTPSGIFAALFNITGQPAISLPLHWTAEGLPVGVQLVAPFGREDLLIRVAAQIERAQPWADRFAPVFAG